jgi:phosphate transport system permease protein
MTQATGTGHAKIGEALSEGFVKVMASISVVVIAFIFLFIIYKALPVIRSSGLDLLTTNNFDEQVTEGFYDVAGSPMRRFGLLGLLLGTIVTTGLALIVAAIIGIGSAVYISEIAASPVATVLKALVRLLASIPSVIFGLIGVIAVVPFIQEYFVTYELQTEYISEFQMSGLCLLASVIVLLFMIVPTVISLSVDALDAVPHSMKEVGYAFGMSRVRVIRKIALPCARSGIVASVTLAAGRGFGEAIAVSMVCGSLGITPNLLHGLVAFLTPVLPLASAIVNKAEAMSAPSVQSALFACATILLMLGAFMSFATKFVERRMRKAVGY